jgi:Skp family chaperone for outer membrane proteins
MHSLKAVTLIVCILVLASFAVGANNFGIHDTGRVVFHSPTRVGGSLLPAGEYVVRHTMEGEEHVMVFQAADHKIQDVKIKCQLVKLQKKADQTRTVFAVNAANERVLQELVFAGDTSKHVF